MEEKKPVQKKLSYEQLENVANQLSMQLQQAKQQINQISNVLTKLPYLFKVVELGNKFDEKFVAKCTQEIENIIQPEEVEEKENEETK